MLPSVATIGSVGCGGSVGCVGIVGAGVLGSLLALRFSAAGWRVTLFEKDPANVTNSASAAAAGMLCPHSELDSAEPIICKLGKSATEMWPLLLREFSLSVFFQRAGSLAIVHPQDMPDLERFTRNIAGKGAAQSMRKLAAPELRELEAELDPRFVNGVYFQLEGQLDNRELLLALKAAFLIRRIEHRWGDAVHTVNPHAVSGAEGARHFDLVLDCRGIGAKAVWKELRAVRGELIRIHCPEVHLKRPIRFLHPRYPLYIVPRPRGIFILGATMIESEDLSPISVRSTLELLSAAFSVNSGFAEARILETVVGLRPAFAHHSPRIRHRPGLIEINGLYRHGFLISPKLVELVYHFVLSGKPDPEFGELFEAVTA